MFTGLENASGFPISLADEQPSRLVVFAPSRPPEFCVNRHAANLSLDDLIVDNSLSVRLPQARFS